MSAFISSFLREFRFLQHNPWDAAVVLWLPIGCIVIFACIFLESVPLQMPIVLVDADQSATSRKLRRIMMATPGIGEIKSVSDLNAAWVELRSGNVATVVFIPDGTQKKILNGQKAILFSYFNDNFRAKATTASRGVASAVDTLGAEVALSELALQGKALTNPTLNVQRTSLSNVFGSQEFYLVSMLIPGILQLLAAIAMTSALGRELRDSSVNQWIATCRGHLLPAILGKLSLYVLIFTIYGALGLFWFEIVRGWEVNGSSFLIIFGQSLMYMAYGVMSLLFVGITQGMRTGLSMAGVFCSPAIAYSGYSLPLANASVFTKGWSALIPFSAYIQLQAQQMTTGASMSGSLPMLSSLLLFIVLPAWPAWVFYRRVCLRPECWGAR